MMRRKIAQLKDELTEVRKDNKILSEQYQDSHDKLLRVLDLLREEYLVSTEQHEELADLANKPLQLGVPSSTATNFSDRHYK